MKIHIKIFLLILIVLIQASFIHAQGKRGGLTKSDLYLNKMKKEISAQLKENMRLTSIHDSLEKEYYQLYAKVYKLQEIVDSMVEYSWSVAKESKDRDEMWKLLKKSYEDLERDIDVKKSRNAFLKGFTLDSDASKNLISLKLKELGFRIRELELDLELKKNLLKEKETKYSGEIEKLKNRKDAKKEELKQLEKQISSIDIEAARASETISSLEKEIRKLDESLGELRNNGAILQTKFAILEDKKKLAMFSLDNDIEKSERKKEHLISVVKELKKDYGLADESVKQSIISHNRKKKLIETIKQVDIENRDLEQKIYDAKQKVENLKP